MSNLPWIAGALALAAAKGAQVATAAARDEAATDEMLRPNTTPPSPVALAAEIAVSRGCDPRLLLATIDTESNWVASAVNDGPGDAARGGAWGLTQITLKTAIDVDDQNGGEWGRVCPGRDPRTLLDPWWCLTLSSHLLRENAAHAAAAGFEVGTELHAANVASLYNSGRLLASAPASTRDVHVPRFLRNWRKRGSLS